MGLTCVNSVCRSACDLDAGGGEPGACAGDEACRGLQINGASLAFGFCDFACNPISQDCSGAGEFCHYGELFSEAAPVCVTAAMNLPAGGDCATAGLIDGQLCGPNRGCEAGLCTQYCVVDNPAGFGQSHPLCGAGETCEPLGTVPRVGRCE